MKTFCITLKSCKERQENTASLLNEMDIPFDFWFGVDARTDHHPLLNKYCEQGFLHRMGRPAAKGELGCYASHYLLWQKCVELNEPILVLEDDLVIDTELFPKTVSIAKQHINSCGYIRMENADRNRLHYRVRQYEHQRLVKYLKVPQCTAAYAITPSAAKAFLENSDHFYYPVDVFLRNAWIHKQTMFGVLPAGLSGGNTASIIGNRKNQGKKRFSTVILRACHKLKSMTLNLTTNLYHLGKLGSNYKPLRWWIG